MEALKFSTVLKELSVVLTSKDGEKNYKLRELTGGQRNIYNKSFDVKFEMVGNKPKIIAGQDFEMMSSSKFLAMCLYDETDKLIPESVISAYPDTTVSGLHTEAMKLSGMDKESLETAKNESGERDISGIE